MTPRLTVQITPHFDGRRWLVALHDDDLRVTFAATDEVLDAIVETVQRRQRNAEAAAVAASGVAADDDGA